MQIAAAAYIVIHLIIKKREKKKRRWWTKRFFTNRLHYGNTLYDDITFEEDDQNFLRISKEDLEYLTNLIRPAVEKSNTYMRDAISVNERVMVTLRFLATGDSYASLQYLFRISRQSISSIIPEVCDALIEALKDYIKVRYK